jgi:hypothetical protein
MDNKLRDHILKLLDRPVNLMREQHDSIEALKEVARRDQSRINEIELAINKFTRGITTVQDLVSDVEELKMLIKFNKVFIESNLKTHEDKARLYVDRQVQQISNQVALMGEHLQNYKLFEKETHIKMNAALTSCRSDLTRDIVKQGEQLLLFERK